MNLKVNEYIGKSPRHHEDHLNIYAFLFKDDEISIDVVGVDYPINVVETKVFAKKIMSMGPTKAQMENLSYLQGMAKLYKPISGVHVIYSRSSKRLMETNDNDKSDKSYLIDAVKKWLVSYPEITDLSSEEEINSDVKVDHWPHRSYTAMPVWTFKGLSRFIDVDKLGGAADIWVIAYDSRDSKIVSEIEKQVSPSRKTAGTFKDSFNNDTAFMSDYDVVLNGERFSGPVILLNKKGKSEFDIEMKLFLFLVDYLSLSEEVQMDTQIKQQQYLGYDVQDLFYFNFGDKSKLNTFSSSFDYSSDPKTRTDFMNQLVGLGVNPNDADTLKFAKTLFIYLRSFPPGDTRFHYKIFYSVVSLPLTFKGIIENPIAKNEGLFDKFFNITEGPVVSMGRVFYLISSMFCFPLNIFQLFIPDKSLELHETFEFNSKNGMLSKYCFVDKTPKDNVALTDYGTKVVKPFFKSIEEALSEMGQKIEDNRYNERLSVKRLSEFPYPFERIKAAFDREGVDLKDLNVVFVYDETRKNILGGYDSKRLRNTENVDLIEGYAAFPLPLMMFNLANPRVQRREDISGTIIHEGRHYLDDMRFEKNVGPLIEKRKKDLAGKEGPHPLDAEIAEKEKEAFDFFDNSSYASLPEGPARFEKYLSSPHETAAFAEDSLNVLRHYRLEYIYANWVFLKNRIIHEYFGDQENLNHYALPQHLVEVYSTILDKALDLYEDEEQKKRDAAASKA